MASIKSIKYHILRDTADRRVYVDEANPDKARDRDMYENRIAFVCLLPHPDGNIYCGLTAWNSDVFHKFDPRTGKFTSLGYQKVAEENEVKIHRSLELASDGTIYGASATLYSLDNRLKTPGGVIFHYDPKTNQIKKLAIPCKHDYPQTITLDEKRKLIYGMTQPVFKFFVYHIDTGEVEDYDYMGSITHISAIDDSGCYWGTWDSVRHNLFKYDPSTRKITYFKHGIPEGARFADVMYRGAGPVDMMLNIGDGYLYIGTTGGTLCRLDPRTAEVKYIGRPHPTKRMPGMAKLDNHRILLAGGDEDGGFLAIYDTRTGGFEHLGKLIEPKTGFTLYRVHDMCLSLDKKTAYIAETDVPTRAGYLWECQLET